MLLNRRSSLTASIDVVLLITTDDSFLSRKSPLPPYPLAQNQQALRPIVQFNQSGSICNPIWVRVKLSVGEQGVRSGGDAV